MDPANPGGDDAPRREDSPIDRLLRGSSLASASARLLGEGLILERRTAPVRERAEEVLDHHYMLLWEGEPTFAERAYRPGRFTRVAKLPGTVSIGAAGLLPAVVPITPYHVVACAIDPAVADRFAQENDLPERRDFVEQLGVKDATLTQLVGIAAGEAAEGNPNGRLFSEHLGYALISRFVTLARTDAPTLPRAHALPKPPLRRVLDLIEADFERNLSVAELAGVAGYSPSHFLRMFRVATGMTPHRYLMEVRLKRAVALIDRTSDTLVDIAVATGFASHAHLTRIFRERYGVTPSEFRRK